MCLLAIPEPAFHLEGFPALDRSCPVGQGPNAIVGVEELRPPRPQALLRRGPRKVVPAAIEIIYRSVRSGGPDHLRDEFIQDRADLLADFFLRILPGPGPRRWVGMGNKAAQHSAQPR